MPALATIFSSLLCIGLVPYPYSLLHLVSEPGSLFRLEQVMVEQPIGERNALMLQQLHIVVDQSI
jgi:hypothetical protein